MRLACYPVYFCSQLVMAVAWPWPPSTRFRSGSSDTLSPAASCSPWQTASCECSLRRIGGRTAGAQHCSRFPCTARTRSRHRSRHHRYGLLRMDNCRCRCLGVSVVVVVRFLHYPYHSTAMLMARLTVLLFLLESAQTLHRTATGQNHT